MSVGTTGLVGEGMDTPGLPVGEEGEPNGVSGADGVITAAWPPGVKVNQTHASFVLPSRPKKSPSRSV
jgi:hypothetical protein